MRELLWVYVAGKVSDDNSSIQDVITQFRQAGFAISHDWTRASGIEKPYLEHVEWNRAAAEAMSRGEKKRAVFILLCGIEIYGTNLEFAMPISETLQDTFNRRRIYVVGATKELRQSIFFTLLEVAVCESVEEVLADLGH